MSKIGALVQAFGTGLFGFFKLGAAVIVARVLATFGLTLVSVNAILPSLKAFLADYLGRLPASATQFLAAIGFDIFMTMILSALAVAMMGKVMLMPKSVADQLPGSGS